MNCNAISITKQYKLLDDYLLFLFGRCQCGFFSSILWLSLGWGEKKPIIELCSVGMGDEINKCLLVSECVLEILTAICSGSKSV